MRKEGRDKAQIFLAGPVSPCGLLKRFSSTASVVSGAYLSLLASHIASFLGTSRQPKLYGNEPRETPLIVLRRSCRGSSFTFCDSESQLHSLFVFTFHLSLCFITTFLPVHPPFDPTVPSSCSLSFRPTCPTPIPIPINCYSTSA